MAKKEIEQPETNELDAALNLPADTATPAVASMPAAAAPEPRTLSHHGPLPGKVWHNGRLKDFNPAESGAKFQINSPNEQYNGERAGISFRNGIGFTDDAEIVPFFRDSLKWAVIDLAKEKAKEKK